MLCFLNVLFIIQATLVLKKNIKIFFRSVVNFPENDQRYCAQFLLWPTLTARNSWIFGASVGSEPWTPSKALPWGPYSTPDPQLARAMTFSCRHDIIKNPTNFWWWWFEGGSHEIFTNREGGSTIFLLLPGGIKNLTESFIPFLPHPP